VFGPVAFVSGLTVSSTGSSRHHRHLHGDSAFNSLTLSPALAAVLLKPHGAKPDFLMRAMNRLLGRFFKRFNQGFGRAGDRYSGRSPSPCATAHRARHLRGLIVLTWFGFNAVPAGFIRRWTSSTWWRWRSCRRPPRSIAPRRSLAASRRSR